MSEKELLAEVVNRICNYAEIDRIYVSDELSDIEVYCAIQKNVIKNRPKIQNGELYVLWENDAFFDFEMIGSICNSDDVIIILYSKSCPKFDEHTQHISVPLFAQRPEYGYLTMFGALLAPDRPVVPDTFKILAVMHVYNEIDIIERTIDYLIGQGIHVLVIDNWSDDGTYEIVNSVMDRYPDKLFLKRFPESGRVQSFNLYEQLKYTEQTSETYDFDWFIHYDADEIRVSPWKGMNLREAIYCIDQMGFNSIDNTVIDFRLTSSGIDDIFMQDTWFEFGKRRDHFRQRKTWKKAMYVELKSTGGHIAELETPRVFPLKILNKHYPLRSIAHAEKKIYHDRIPRFGSEKKERGWHGQYDRYIEGAALIYDTSNLIKWGDNTFRDYYLQLFMGIGLEEKPTSTEMLSNCDLIQGDERIILYGAGECGKRAYRCLSLKCKIVAWVDRKASYMTWIYGSRISDINILSSSDFDRVVVAVNSEKLFLEIRDSLKDFVDTDRIIWVYMDGEQ